MTGEYIYRGFMAFMLAAIAFCVVMLGLTIHAEARESAICETRGGVYVERTCLTNDAVISLEERQ